MEIHSNVYVEDIVQDIQVIMEMAIVVREQQHDIMREQEQVVKRKHRHDTMREHDHVVRQYVQAERQVRHEHEQ